MPKKLEQKVSNLVQGNGSAKLSKRDGGLEADLLTAHWNTSVRGWGDKISQRVKLNYDSVATRIWPIP